MSTSQRKGVHPPWDHDAFSPLFQITPHLFSKKFQTLWKSFYILPFPEKLLDFHPPKFLMTVFLVIDHTFRISPYFPCFSTFPPCFPKMLFSPYFYKFPLCFRQIHLLFTYLLCILFPPTLTMMHLCITQCTYWTPLSQRSYIGQHPTTRVIRSSSYFSVSTSSLILSEGLKLLLSLCRTSFLGQTPKRP